MYGRVRSSLHPVRHVVKTKPGPAGDGPNISLASLEATRHSHEVPAARLVDVAALAGVSVKTVSNVVNAHPQVRAGTRARVQEAIDALGYRPHAVGRQLRSGRTGRLSLAVPEVDYPYFAELARHVVDAAAERSMVVVVRQTASRAEAERRLLHAGEDGLVDALLMSPVATGAEELAAGARSTPLVLLGEGARPAEVDHVGIDDVAAAEEATRHLLATGRRRVAFLGGHPEGPVATSRVRQQGWVQAVAATGAQPGPWLGVEDFSAAAGAASAARALTTATRPDALLCASDTLALGAVRAVQQAGLVVGRDVAVVGWDDSAFAAWTTPSLTSVRPDLGALAEAALDLLVDRVERARADRAGGDTLPGRHVVVGHELVVRESSGAGPGPGRP